MARPHDLGGRTGFGPVPVTDDALFHADWERRAFAVTQLAQVLAGFNTDAFRHGVEREDPDVYASIAYFDKWIRNGERMLVEGGVLAADALAAHQQGHSPVAPVERTTDAVPHGARGNIRAVSTPPLFAVGSRVVVNERARDDRHSRLPDYVVGRTGTVVLANGGWIFPDTHAHGQGEDPTWVYAVGFDANELWPEDRASHNDQASHTAQAGHIVHVDLFEPYLRAA